ncbi:hypothetical protein, partial [Arcobacter ellisii]
AFDSFTEYVKVAPSASFTLPASLTSIFAFSSSSIVASAPLLSVIVPVPVAVCVVICASVGVAVNVTVSSFSVIASSFTVTFTRTEDQSTGRFTFHVAGTSNHVVPPSVDSWTVLS